MAPVAAHIAALEKYGGADAFSVVQAELLNVGNDSCHVGFLFCHVGKSSGLINVLGAFYGEVTSFCAMGTKGCSSVSIA